MCACPQKENGYTPIANEIMEQLYSYKMSGSEWQIIMCVLRKTYGWHKKEDNIALTQFERETRLSRKCVCNALKKLVNKKILLVNKETPPNRYKFNKNWEKWVVNKKAPLVNKRVLASEQTGKKVVNKMTHTKESITKESIQKKDTRDLKVSVKEIFDFFITSFKKNPKTYKLSPLRRKKIQVRLKDAGGKMLRKAILRTSESSFHRGDNDRGWEADLDFIIRSYEQVEKLSQMEIKKRLIAEDGTELDTEDQLIRYNKTLKERKKYESKNK